MIQYKNTPAKKSFRTLPYTTHATKLNRHENGKANLRKKTSTKKKPTISDYKYRSFFSETSSSLFQVGNRPEITCYRTEEYGSSPSGKRTTFASNQRERAGGGFAPRESQSSFPCEDSSLSCRAESSVDLCSRGACDALEKEGVATEDDTMDGAGAYGGGKAGGAFDPITFVQRPHVILRAVNWLFAVIVFGCISSQGWLQDPETKEETCLYNGDANACNYGVGISVIAFLASMGFLAGEYFFEQMSSVKTRKHYVLGDLGFSAFWAFLYFVGFCYLANAWGKAERPPQDYGVNNVQAAIVFSFFAIFSWAGSSFLAFQRFKQGADAAFTAGFQEGSGGPPYDTNTFDQAYQDPPFSQSQIPDPNNYQEPTY